MTFLILQSLLLNDLLPCTMHVVGSYVWICCCIHIFSYCFVPMIFPISINFLGVWSSLEQIFFLLEQESMKFVMHLYLTMIALCYDAAYLSSKPCGLFQVRIQIVGQSCLVGPLFLLITWNLCGMNDCFIQVILITYNIQNKF